MREIVNNQASQDFISAVINKPLYDLTRQLEAFIQDIDVHRDKNRSLEGYKTSDIKKSRICNLSDSFKCATHGD